MKVLPAPSVPFVPPKVGWPLRPSVPVFDWSPVTRREKEAFDAELMPTVPTLLIPGILPPPPWKMVPLLYRVPVKLIFVAVRLENTERPPWIWTLE